ncbi:COG3650 family protein [Aquipseudomonas campi]
MSPVRCLLFAMLPLFAGCQLFATKAEPEVLGQRLQGELGTSKGKLLFRPCQDQRTFSFSSDGNPDLMREISGLLADGGGPVFADLSGQLRAGAVADTDGQLKLTQLYRIQHEGHGCDDPDFKRLILRASGNEPDWSVNVTGKGLALMRPGQPPLALPYLEETLPDGSFNLSSEANGQRFELWVAPQRCTDTMSGAIQHLSAELRLDGVVHRGCASLGGARNR